MIEYLDCLKVEFLSPPKIVCYILIIVTIITLLIAYFSKTRICNAWREHITTGGFVCLIILCSILLLSTLPSSDCHRTPYQICAIKHIEQLTS
jgi:hypothetical protein